MLIEQFDCYNFVQINSRYKFRDEIFRWKHTCIQTPEKHTLLGAVSMSKSLLSAHVAQSFKSVCHLSLQLTQVLLWPALQCQNVSALPLLGSSVWAPSACEVSDIFTRHISAGALLLGLLEVGKKASAGAHHQEQGSNKQGTVLSAGSWVSDKLTEASPSLSNSFSEANQSPERSCPINVIHRFHSTYTHTPVSNCSGEEVPGDIRIKYTTH